MRTDLSNHRPPTSLVWAPFIISWMLGIVPRAWRIWTFHIYYEVVSMLFSRNHVDRSRSPNRGRQQDRDVLRREQKRTLGRLGSPSLCQGNLSLLALWLIIPVAGCGGSGTNGGPTTTPPPTITSLSRTSGAVGVKVTIAGSNFGARQGSSAVTFNGAPAGTASTWSATSVTVIVPTGATTGNVMVTVSGVASNRVALHRQTFGTGHYRPQPRVGSDRLD